MCDKFFESVGVPEHILFSSPLNVIHQIGEKVEGGFISHFMLAQFFRKYEEDKPRALIVSSHHSKHHWLSIGTKLGTNLGALLDKGNISVIDLMKETFDKLKSGDDTDGICLTTLYKRCEEIIKDFKTSGSKRILIVVEDCTNFLQSDNLFKSSERLVLELILKLKALSVRSREDEQCFVSVVGFVQSPEVASEAPELTRFAKMMAQTLPSVLFEVAPLSTGFSTQVTGYLKIIFSPNTVPHNNKVDVPFIRNFHFKLESNYARVIPL